MENYLLARFSLDFSLYLFRRRTEGGQEQVEANLQVDQIQEINNEILDEIHNEIHNEVHDEIHDEIHNEMHNEIQEINDEIHHDVIHNHDAVAHASEEEDEEEEVIPVPIVDWNVRSLNSYVATPVQFKNMGREPVYLFWINFMGTVHFYKKLLPQNRMDMGHCMNTYVTHPWIVVTKSGKRCFLNGTKLWFPPDPETWVVWKFGWVSRKWNYHENERYDFEVNGDSYDIYEGDDVESELINLNINDGDNLNVHEGDNLNIHDGDNLYIHEGNNMNPYDGDNLNINDGDDSSSSDNSTSDGEGEIHEGEYDVVRAENESQFLEVLVVPPGPRTLREITNLRCCRLFPTQREVQRFDIPSCLKNDIATTRRKHFYY